MAAVGWRILSFIFGFLLFGTVYMQTDLWQVHGWPGFRALISALGFDLILLVFCLTFARVARPSDAPRTFHIHPIQFALWRSPTLSVVLLGLGVLLSPSSAAPVQSTLAIALILSGTLVLLGALVHAIRR